ncbi:uncharacterized membrane protein At3g27390-like [Cucurbita pepo subsp. pepo]|uniref:uncharacterized membrane protein At3g27390-like n=1 Tax=Cucurbita pepo subsp. pepo TaxID=3664 RepID=UPI000C9D7CC0|nr:uncharacterized membrane protein At3g27390-like [Cucurbita pepo subsp. pepo]
MEGRDLETSEGIEELGKKVAIEAPNGAVPFMWSFICNLPSFTVLFLLGITKGAMFSPLTSLIMTLANSSLIMVLWPIQTFWTYHCILRAQQLGWGLKLLLCLCVLPVLLLLWPEFGAVISTIGGAVYGFLSPLMATFNAAKEDKPDKVFHCLYDGTWDTIKGSFMVIGDFRDVCLHSYFSTLEELLQKGNPEAGYYDIRLFDFLCASIVGVLGSVVDTPVILLIALYKCPFMLIKGWRRLFHDLIGRKGPFSETICVPFAGLAILLWPLAVVGALVGSIISSIFLGAYAGVIVYQESSFWLGLCYILASISIYDEYSNDFLDMANGSCFPRPIYRKKDMQPPDKSQEAQSVRRCPSLTDLVKNIMLELKPLELLDNFSKECKRQGILIVSKGLITLEDIEHAKSNNDTTVLSIGLPAYCLLQMIIRSAKADSAGLLLSDEATEITSENRPQDIFYDWFLNPLLIIKEQIKAINMSEQEEEYLSRLVLLGDDPIRMKDSNLSLPPESKCKCAELEALARRLRGITRLISRFPTFKRRFASLVDAVYEDIIKKNDRSRPSSRRKISKSQSAIGRFLSQISFKNKTGNDETDQEPNVVEKDVESKLT